MTESNIDRRLSRIALAMIVAGVIVALTARTISAQRVTITSQAATDEWVDVMIPLAVATPLPNECLVQPQGWRAVRATDNGIHGTVFSIHARGMVPGQRYTGTLEPAPESGATFVATDWVGDDLDALRIEFAIKLSSEPEGDAAPIRGPPVDDAEAVAVVDAPRPETDSPPIIVRPEVVAPWGRTSAARQVWRSRATSHGYTAEVWGFVYHRQDIVDFQATLTWSDYSVRPLTQRVEWVELRCGEAPAVDFAVRNGFDPPEPPGSDGRWHVRLLTDVAMDHGVSIPITGRLAALPQSGPAANWIKQADRIGRARDSVKGRAYGISLDWRGHWLATGVVPEPVSVYEDTRVANFLTRMNQAAGLFADRPLGLARQSGVTGGQADFGVAHGYGCAVGDPLWIPMLRQNGVGDALRFFHFRDATGARQELQGHQPIVRTWNLEPDSRTSNLLGKEGRGWSNRFGSHRWSGIDEEHYSTNARMAWHALTGSPIAEAIALDELESVLSEVRGRTGAARAFGRRLHAWRNLYLMLSREADRQALKDHAERLIGYQTNSRPYTGQDIWPISVTRDSRRLNGRPAWAPWEHSFCVLGLYAWGEHELARRLARMVVRYGIYEGNDSRFHGTADVAYLENGEQLPDQTGGGTHAVREGDALPDYLYEDPRYAKAFSNFDTWYVPTLLIAHELDVERPRVEAILRDWYPRGPTNWGLAQWAAIKGGWPR